jgi:AraC-like DNA-binding protein
MEYTELRPPPPLDRLVHCLWFLRGQADGSVQTIVPDGRAEVVVHAGDAFNEVHEGGLVFRQDDVLVGGQLLGPLRLQPHGTMDVVGIRFRTAAARSVLRFPLSEVSLGVQPLRPLHRALAEGLHDAVQRGVAPHERAAAIARALVRFVATDADPVTEDVTRSLGAVDPPPVRELARRHGVSPRTLERRLLRDVGLSPKALQRVLRFRRAFRWLDRAPTGTWASVAARTGYFDQAHLSREFRALAGAPPVEFFRRDPGLARRFTEGD